MEIVPFHDVQNVPSHHLHLLIPGPDMHRPRKPHAPPPKNIDPYTVSYIVPFNYFCEWYKATNARTLSKTSEISKDELQESFIKYRDDLLSRTAKDFVKEHLTEPWFNEKYDSSEALVTKGKRVEYRRWLYEMFMNDLDNGKFDELTLDGVAGIFSVGIGINGLARRYYSERNGTQQVQSPGAGKEGEIAAAESPSNKSIVGIQAPSDPMSERRTPCIKTISTSVSRAQLEAVPSISSRV
jgi:SERRATE/Ars2, N-terminal domain